MKQDLTEVITTLMQSYDEYYDESIIKGIRSLASKWPNLTTDEKKEIEAVAIAFKIMSDDTAALDDEDVEDYEYDEKDDLNENETYYNGPSSYPETIEEPQKRGLFRWKKK